MVAQSIISAERTVSLPRELGEPGDVVIFIKDGDKFLLSPASQKKSENEIPVTEINAASESFSFLDDEPDLYTLSDLQEKYV